MNLSRSDRTCVTSSVLVGNEEKFAGEHLLRRICFRLKERKKENLFKAERTLLVAVKQKKRIFLSLHRSASIDSIES